MCDGDAMLCSGSVRCGDPRLWEVEDGDVLVRRTLRDLRFVRTPGAVSHRSFCRRYHKCPLHPRRSSLRERTVASKRKKEVNGAKRRASK